MTKFKSGERLGPKFTCATNAAEDDEYVDALRVFNYVLVDDPVLALQTMVDDSVGSVWLDRTQVQDLMVVLAYWLHETEEEAE